MLARTFGGRDRGPSNQPEKCRALRHSDAYASGVGEHNFLQTEKRLGRTPSTAGPFRRKFRKNSGKIPETLSERFLEFPSRVRLGSSKPYNSRHLRLPEHFQNSLPPSTAGDVSFFRSGSGEGLSEPVMEFPAVLGVFLKDGQLGFSEHSSLLLINNSARSTCKVSLSGSTSPRSPNHPPPTSLY